MSVSEHEIIRKAQQWVAYADDDLQVAKHVLTLENKTPFRLVAYHAQQCAEKYLKAYLVYHRIDFPHTHRILLLLELCPGRHEWPNNLEDAEELTPFAVMARYPSEYEPVTEAEAKRAVEIAEQVRTTMSNELSRKGVNF